MKARSARAQAAFGSGRVLIEKYVAAPRHIEIQIFADRHGNIVHLGERDCSLQRRHQKVIEEAPAPGMTADLRAQMGAAAVEAARAVGYVGAGTVEFVADGTKDCAPDAFWFIEMNTRLQVEHPVTEAVTGLDLVEWQFRIAAGEKLPLTQERDPPRRPRRSKRGVYAEDPEHGFLPSTGTIVGLELPDDLRVDSGVEAGGEVTPFYDPMIAKLIAHAPTREAALDRLAHALDRTLIAGVRSNVAFLGALCRAPRVPRAAWSIPASSTAIWPRSAPCRRRRHARPQRSALPICSTPRCADAPPAKTPRSRIPPGRHATASSSAARVRSAFRS